jgi:hypothetical protein
MNRKSATFGEFKDYTLAVARGEHTVDPSEAKVWHQQIEDANPNLKSGPDHSKSAADQNSDYLHSTLRERIVEHVFVGDALRRLWQLGVTNVEVLRSEFDAGGYDLVMSYGRTVRHIQFKTATEGSKTVWVTVSLKLMEKPAGCVIWIIVSPRLELKSFRWLGGAPGEPLPDISALKVAKFVRANATGTKRERPNYRRVPRSRFEQLTTLDAVLDRLFGPLP